MKERKILTIVIGEKYFDERGEVKTLCFVEKNYVAIKRPRCKPFILTLNEFSKFFSKKA